jgi:hypothetical protein
MNNSPTIIDSFPYAGEKLVLEIRLAELAPIVTKFLIIESNRTQTGLPKPYYFEEQQKSFEQYKDKIVYVKLDDSDIDKTGIGEADWSQEFRVREAIVKEGFEAIEATGLLLLADTILMISDCDEIPKKEAIQEFINHPNEPIVCLNHYFNSYYLNLYSNFREWGWYGTILVRLGSITGHSIQRLRNIKDRLPHTGASGEGWHFSNLLVKGFNGLYEKWKNNIEPHDKSCLTDKEKLKLQFNQCLKEKHFFFCDNPDKRAILLEELPLDLLPECVKNDIKKYKKLIFNEKAK